MRIELLHGLRALVLMACGFGLAAAPAAAQTGPTAQYTKQQQVAKKPAPKKKAQKKPPAKKETQPATRKPQAAQVPARPPQAAAPRLGTDTESSIVKPGDHGFSIQHGGVARSYRIHVPPGYNVSSPAPLLVALHGGGPQGDLQANEAYYGLNAKSDREGFVLVFPHGLGRNQDDVGFIRQVVNNVFRQMSIQRGRIFAAGLSDGGMMAYRLACELPELFKAVASVGGTDSNPGCAPGSAVSVLHIHARDDAQVPFAGAPETAAKWAQLNGCTARPRRILEKGGAYCEAYSYCRGQAEVQLCATETGGHSWPGGRTARIGGASQAISATDLIWDFFSRR